MRLLAQGHPHNSHVADGLALPNRDVLLALLDARLDHCVVLGLQALELPEGHNGIDDAVGVGDSERLAGADVALELVAVREHETPAQVHPVEVVRAEELDRELAHLAALVLDLVGQEAREADLRRPPPVHADFGPHDVAVERPLASQALPAAPGLLGLLVVVGDFVGGAGPVVGAGTRRAVEEIARTAAGEAPVDVDLVVDEDFGQRLKVVGANDGATEQGDKIRLGVAFFGHVPIPISDQTSDDSLEISHCS